MQSMSDVEKQPLLEQYQYGHAVDACPCRQAGYVDYRAAEARRNRRKRRFGWLFFGFMALMLVGFSHRQRINHYMHHHHQGNLERQPQISANALSTSVQDKVSLAHGLTYCSTSPTIPWHGNTEIDLSEGTVGLSVAHKAHTGGKVSLRGGDVRVVQNAELKTPRVTILVHLDTDELQDEVTLEQKQEEGFLGLILHTQHNNWENGCLTINVKVELPALDSLEILDLGFISNDVTFEEAFKFKYVLHTATVSGHIIGQKVLAAPELQFATVSGNVNAEVDEIDGTLNIHAVSGNVEIRVLHIEKTSDVKAEAVSGNVKLVVPSSFDSSFKMSVLSGQATLDTSVPEKTHFKVHRGPVGKTITGYVGDSDDQVSHIELNTVSGNVHLAYE
ncbi:hypothetical protein BC940DRAFT_322755 [Gongronella butleri]|nr:hypothetical protein BC940DRAFT_322755 [Gongronella butleri]